MVRNELVKSFESEGFLLMNVMGMIEDEKTINFFLDEEEKIDAFAISCMMDWGYDRKEFLEFQGITIEDDDEVIQNVADEFFVENNNMACITRCIKVTFNK